MRIFILPWLFFPLALIGQGGTLLVSEGQTYVLDDSILVLDKLILEKNSTLILSSNIAENFSIICDTAEFYSNAKLDLNGQDGVSYSRVVFVPNTADDTKHGINGQPGRNGTNATDAANLFFHAYVKRMDRLVLTAKGGNGGNGEFGGTGGKGGRASCSKGKGGGNGGRGGSGGAAGIGGKGGLVTFSIVEGSANINYGLNLMIDVSGGRNGNPGNGGAGGAGGDNREGCLGFINYGGGATGPDGKDGARINEYPPKGDLIVSMTNKLKGDLINVSPSRLVFDQNQRSHALIIACGEYDYLEPRRQLLISELQAKRLAGLLIQKYTFNRKDVELVMNKEKREIIEAIQQKLREVEENENLLIFYTGHGKYLREEQLGFWLASDSKWEDLYDDTWIGNDKIIRDIRTAEFKGRHLLVIADACFAGALILSPPKGSPLFEDRRRNSIKSVRALAAAGLRTVTSDSPFFEYLYEILDTNRREALSTEDIYFKIQQGIRDSGRDDIPFPVYGTIRTFNETEGRFYFVRK